MLTCLKAISMGNKYNVARDPSIKINNSNKSKVKNPAKLNGQEHF